MSNIYTVKYKNFVVGTIDFDSYEFKPNGDCNSKLVPRELKNPTKDNVIAFLKSRVVQEDNQGLPSILHDLGLETYDVKKLIDCTKGMDLNDCIWVVKDPNEDYYKIHVRENYTQYFRNVDL